MYRGMGPPLVGVTPIFALSFWVRQTCFLLLDPSTAGSQRPHPISSAILLVLRPWQEDCLLVDTE